MAENPIDAYLEALDEPKQSTLRALRATLRDLLPHAEEGLAYGAPAFKVGGRNVAGFAAHKNHLSYFPHSGSVLGSLGDRVADYETSKGVLRFAVDTPLPRPLVEKLVAARLQELDTG